MALARDAGVNLLEEHVLVRVAVDRVVRIHLGFAALAVDHGDRARI